MRYKRRDGTLAGPRHSPAMRLPSRTELQSHHQHACEVLRAASDRWLTLHGARVESGERFADAWQVDLRAFVDTATDRVLVMAALNKREEVGTSLASGDPIVELDEWSRLLAAGTREVVCCKLAEWLVPYGFLFRSFRLEACERFIVDFDAGAAGAVSIEELGPAKIPPDLLHGRARPARRSCPSVFEDR